MFQKNNIYSRDIIKTNPISKSKPHNPNQIQIPKLEQKLANFTYFGQETCTNSRLFKNAKLKTNFNTNFIRNNLIPIRSIASYANFHVKNALKIM
jgi:hypothetical protein